MATKRPPPDPHLVRASRTLAVATRVLETSLDAMTMPQFRVLSLVDASPERAGRIATKAGVTRPSLTGLLDGLVAKGWVERMVVDDDRRGVRLEITREGRRALDQARRTAADKLDAVLDLVPADERDTALQGLAALGRALDLHLERVHETETNPETPSR